MSIRTKAIMSMMLLVSLICGVFLYILYQQNQEKLDQLIEGKRVSAHLLAETLLQQTAENYRLRLRSLINYRASESRLLMIEAFAKRDRETLLRTSRPLFEVLKQENSYVASFGWILPDNELFLRVHEPDKTSVDVSTSRPDIVAANRDQAPYSGFLTGHNGPQLRIVQPVFYQNRFLGVVQLGIDARFLIDTLKKKLSIAAGFSVPNERYLNRTRPSHGSIQCETHRIHATDEQLFGRFADIVDWNQKKQQLKLDQKLYTLHKVLPLKDFRDELFGCLFVVIDVTDPTQEAKKVVITTLGLSALLLLLTYVLLYYSFGALVEKIFKLNESLEKSNKELEKRVEERTQALIQETEERKLVQDRLHRAEKMEAIGLMASGVAHDLNNILSGVVSYPELLLMKLPEESKLRQPLTVIKESGLRAAAVVADLLTVARDAAKVKTRTSLNTIILEYLQSPEFHLLRSTYPHIEIKQELDQGLPDLCCSPTHVNKSLMNLVLNAAEAVDDKGLITIRSRFLSAEQWRTQLPPGDYIVLEIADNGPGIESPDLDHIFEPFYTKKKMGRSGTGIGLAVVWNCMQDHGGLVQVESDVEQGTVFTLIFPLGRDEDCQSHRPMTISNLNGSGERILVVDDEQHQREIAVQILSELGYSAVAVSSGEEAVEYIKHHEVALLVLDMVMDPGMDGCTTYAEIIKQRPDQKALVVSGYSESEQLDRIITLGVRDYLVKPYTVEQLARAVKKNLLQK